MGYKEWFEQKVNEDPSVESMGINSTLEEAWDYQQCKIDKLQAKYNHLVQYREEPRSELNRVVGCNQKLNAENMRLKEKLLKSDNKVLLETVKELLNDSCMHEDRVSFQNAEKCLKQIGEK